VRVYLPSTLPLLAAAVAAGEIGPPPLAGCAVTPALREWYVEGDAEELEYVALTAAAAASLELLAADESAPRRRVVVAADVPDPAVRPVVGERAGVIVSVGVPLAEVGAAHVDDPAATAAVEAAVRALVGVDAGDEDAQFLLAEAAAHELGWYAPSEIRELTEAGPPAPGPAR